MQCGSKGPELTRFFADATAWIDGCLVKQAARPFAAVTLSFTTVAVKRNKHDLEMPLICTYNYIYYISIFLYINMSISFYLYIYDIYIKACLKELLQAPDTCRLSGYA